jgi:hypothetical protein
MYIIHRIYNIKTCASGHGGVKRVGAKPPHLYLVLGLGFEV